MTQGPAAGAAPSGPLGGAIAAGIAAFAFRTLAQGRLQNDHYMHLAWAQQILLGDVPGRDFVDPGMPLMYTLSALLQHAWPGPFAEVVLTSAMLALAAALTYWLVRSFTGSCPLALAAVLLEVTLRPRLYGYPKLLVPALVLTAFLTYARRPTLARLATLGACTAIAGLLRYDLGGFAFVSIAAGMAVLGWPSANAAATHGVLYALATAAALAPYLLFVQYSEGIVEHVRAGLEFAKGESHQLLLPWLDLPGFERTPLVGDANAAMWLFCVSYGLLALGMLLVVARLRRHATEQLAVAAAAIAMLACYCLVILRHPIAARVPDLAGVIAIAGAWCASELVALARERFAARPLRWTLALVPLALTMVMTTVSVWQLGRVEESFERTRLRDGVAKVRERIAALAQAGTSWPWRWYWPGGEVPAAVEYLNTCTEAANRALVTWSAPEYYYFARRGFAAGHALFASLRSCATPRDRLKDAVPHPARACADRPGQRNEPAAVRFLVPRAPRLRARARTSIGRYTTRDGSLIEIGARRDARPLDTYGPAAWPCRFARGS